MSNNRYGQTVYGSMIGPIDNVWGQQMPQTYTYSSPMSGETITRTQPIITPPLKPIFEPGDLITLDEKKFEHDMSTGIIKSQSFARSLNRFRGYKNEYNYRSELYDPVYEMILVIFGGYYVPQDYMVVIPKDLNDAVRMMKDYLKGK